MNKLDVAAVVPMKGHSERVPGKNYRPLAGEPLFAYVLQTLLDATSLTRVFVDTDDRKLAAAVLTHFPSIQVIDRPVELHGDFVAMNDVLANDATIIESEWILQTHTTNPLLSAGTVERAIAELAAAQPDFDSLMTVTPMQTRLWWGPGKPVNHDPAVLLRTQDLPVVYEENSNMFLFKRSQILETGVRVGDTPLFFEMDRIESWDIDTEHDFEVAEALVTWRKQQ